ncbi:ribosomal protein S5 domain 2-type protein [Gorgonomyces haynaldii]|nr:ribosomal protein S5 domain 2-type protein [Gorgonomyces haynaldii]
MLRVDKRQSTELRELSMMVGQLTRSDGSAKFQFGNTSCLASVYGPIQPRMSELLQRQIKVQITSSMMGPRERYMERMIEETVDTLIPKHLFPRTLIRITVQIQSDDGSVLSCLMNAVLLALVDAAIPLTHLIVSVGSITDSKGQVLLDPTSLELDGCNSRHTFVFDLENRIVGLDSHGSFDEEEVLRLTLV